MHRFARGYEYFCRIILMLMVVQVAFIAHLLLGVVVVGLFPSIAASYATYRTWLIQVDDRSWTITQTWTTFHRAWKAELKRANIFGWPQFLIWLLLVWNYYLLNWNDMGRLGLALSGVSLLVNVLYGLFMMVSWAVYVNFDESPWWVARTSMQMVIARPFCSFMVAVLFVVTVWLYTTWTGLMVALGLSVPIFLTMMAIYSFGRLPGMDVHVLEPMEKDLKKSN
ncbi:DUF624 domain-containing protein [Bifidobacterium callitrichos]|uniref:DUF624 domain-containing protein n=1 Tax=Bifidobacterium callitrichos TaxID=762209 RepID=A0A5M9ZAB9_9BIFI|nr:DUF624 domain-containing protein [Bifidobacterium callitrichos]KAA8815411.1 DUF624 domain-containing protein [Bifidobacterium callitrichos]